jgi:hypothetical protein
MMTRQRDQAELEALKALDAFVRGEALDARPAPSPRQPDRETDERLRRAKMSAAIEAMKADRDVRYAEVTRVVEAIAGALDLDAGRLRGIPYVRAEITALIQMLRQMG